MRKLTRILLFTLLVFASSRLYFFLTDGFRISNITSHFSYNTLYDTRPLTLKEKELVDKILDQPFTYLGKGCQSYVFASEDGEYVLKFFKYQRYRKGIGDYLAFLPGIKEYRKKRIAHKQQKLQKLFTSWKIAFDHLQEETGLVYVHLNKTEGEHATLTIRDKLGIKHEIALDQMEFMIQKRAQMICPAITTLMKMGEEEKAKSLVSQVLKLILSEYQRGYADNDHALMQNTGVVGECPMHVDVGQFVLNEAMCDPTVYQQHLYNKMYKFGLWLQETHPELALDLHKKLNAIIGAEYDKLSYQPSIR